MTSRPNKIRWDLLADDKSLRGATKRAKKGFGGLSDSTKRLGSLFAVTFGARELVQFASDAITASSDYVESVNAVEVATGSAANEIIQLGEDAAVAFGLSKTTGISCRTRHFIWLEFWHR